MILDWQQSAADALVSLATQTRRDRGWCTRSQTTLIVHLSEDAPPLLEGAGPISRETAERLGCDARRLTIKPSGRDLVHSRVGRCASYPQLRALHKRFGHCQAAGCTATRELEAHHLVAVEHGGRTELDNLTLLCPDTTNTTTTTAAILRIAPCRSRTGISRTTSRTSRPTSTARRVWSSAWPRTRSSSSESGLTYQRVPPEYRFPYGHTHRTQEEVYVVVRGSGRMKVDDTILELREWDAVRVPPGTWRGYEAGPEGLELLVIGCAEPRRGSARGCRGRARLVV